jgi:Flp pilus assembly protein TadD
MLSSAPGDATCLALRGRGLILADRAKEALPDLEKATRIQPDDAFVRAAHAFALFRLKQYKEAAREFEKCAALDPTQAANVFNAGYSHFLYGNYRAARPFLERALHAGLDGELAARARENLDLIEGALWACPMHVHVTGKQGERCPDCGMALQPLAHGVGVDE